MEPLKRLEISHIRDEFEADGIMLMSLHSNENTPPFFSTMVLEQFERSPQSTRWRITTLPPGRQNLPQ
jgi:hypothetical protein